MTKLRLLPLSILLGSLIGARIAFAGTRIGMDVTGRVLSYGSSADGAITCDLDSSGVTNLNTALSAPNGGLITQATPDAQGVCIAAQFTPVATPTPTATPLPNPTIAVTAGAGAGATFSLAAGSNLQRGAILLTAGTGPSAGSVLTVTFSTAPYVQIQAIGDNSILVIPYLRSLSNNVATIGTRSAMTAGQVYTIGYVLVP